MGLDKSSLFLAALMAGAHMLASMPCGTTSGYLRSGNFVDFPCKRHLAKRFSVCPCSLCKQGVTGSIPGHVHQPNSRSRNTLRSKFYCTLLVRFRDICHLRSVWKAEAVSGLASPTKTSCPCSSQFVLARCPLGRSETFSNVDSILIFSNPVSG